jgi:hypothetical protein
VAGRYSGERFVLVVLNYSAVFAAEPPVGVVGYPVGHGGQVGGYGVVGCGGDGWNTVRLAAGCYPVRSDGPRFAHVLDADHGGFVVYDVDPCP